AAMASASLVFKEADSTYSSTLLKHAKQLFTFADKHRGIYSENIPEVATYYNSTGYGDELLWAAAWLYHATGDNSYLQYATGQNGEDYAQFGSPTWFSWDNKLAGTQQPVASAFLAAVYSDYMLTTQTPKIKCDSDSFTPSDLRDF
ncbi:endoglucanase 10-like, partial [Trifolium medium]|nr:endoglucanase 10-like [Trifolium medium]